MGINQVVAKMIRASVTIQFHGGIETYFPSPSRPQVNPTKIGAYHKKVSTGAQ